jgi:hypothetical protein
MIVVYGREPDGHQGDAVNATIETDRSMYLSAVYMRAKYRAKLTLGGNQAYRVVGPTVRRMAVSAAILQLLATQDEDDVSDAAVRSLVQNLHNILMSDSDFAGAAS